MYRKCFTHWNRQGNRSNGWEKQIQICFMWMLLTIDELKISFSYLINIDPKNIYSFPWMDTLGAIQTVWTRTEVTQLKADRMSISTRYLFPALQLTGERTVIAGHKTTTQSIIRAVCDQPMTSEKHSVRNILTMRVTRLPHARQGRSNEWI